MSDPFRRQGRRRAENEREAIEWAVGRLETLASEAGVDPNPLLEYARESKRSLPDRHRRAHEAMAETLDVDPATYEVYVFAFADLCEELADEGAAATATADQPGGLGRVDGRGCTNVLLAPVATAGDAPLVLKNRDIAGRGVRPKAVVEQPPIGEYHGYITVDTVGTVLCYKGVNDRGLVAANTYVDVECDGVEPAERVRNGTAVRRILEECATVSGARALLESIPLERLAGQTLFLADAEETRLLEVDPTDRIAVVDDEVAVRTNHLVAAESTAEESSIRRRERALALLGADGEAQEGDEHEGRNGTGERTRREPGNGFDRAALWRIANDHANGPGDDSICRHPEPETDEPYAFGQLTTASAAVFEGGTPAIEFTTGNPCERERIRCALGEGIPSDLESGRRWLEANA